ncbi:LHFPL tetraspan subfamily member 3 protein-like isoform X1 [Argopecten irradians]|uniref:LHFPL tetraspan subfamily member 3 protein-like isoform X1 n=1 Tax=Argopecten irradians TaxID=31199 RepID=UPI003718AE46
MSREIAYSTEVTKLRHNKYKWASRVITVMWAILTICFAILNAVAFVQPQWLGDTTESPGVGFFGLYEYCETLQVDGDYACKGDFMSFTTILNDSFRAASMLVGISALLFILSVICILLFFFLKADKVLKICGWLQLLASLCITVGCIVFPSGWDDEMVRKVCGKEAGKYHWGRCNMRWAFILSIVLIFDGFVLSFLAFMLAKRQANLLPKYKEEKSAGIANAAFSSSMNGSYNPVMYPAEEKPQHFSTFQGPQYGQDEVDHDKDEVFEAYDRDQDIRL